MTQREAQAATMIYDEIGIEIADLPCDEPTLDADPALDTIEGETLLLGVTAYS